MFGKIRGKNKEYKPYEYWIQRGKKYEENYVETKERIKQEEELTKYFRKLSFESVLEFGCGFGRMTKLVAKNFPIKRYLAFDLSPRQIENAKKNCKNFDYIEFQVNTINDLAVNEKFDLVFGTNVFLHIPPTEIRPTIQKILSLTKKT